MSSISLPADAAVCIRHNNCKTKGRQDGAAERERHEEREKGGGGGGLEKTRGRTEKLHQMEKETVGETLGGGRERESELERERWRAGKTVESERERDRGLSPHQTPVLYSSLRARAPEAV